MSTLWGKLNSIGFSNVYIIVVKSSLNIPVTLANEQAKFNIIIYLSTKEYQCMI